VRTYPEPQKEVSLLVSQSSVITVNPYGPHLLLPIYTLEAQRWVKRILKLQPKGFASLLLYFRRKFFNIFLKIEDLRDLMQETLP